MHHAYVYEGPLLFLTELAADARERFGFAGEHHADVHVREFEKFGIDESRWLVGAAALKSSSGRALFVVGISSITTEAQQALLKLLEEPQVGMLFVLLVPNGVLLPTVMSRVQAYPGRIISRYKSDAASIFLAASAGERAKLVEFLLKKEEGSREGIRDFINALEAELYKKIKEPKVRAALSDISLVRDYLRDRSPSLKMLLEHVSLSLPTV